METFITLAQIDKITKKIKEKVPQLPEVGIILGSGLGHLADSVQDKQVLYPADLTGWPQSTVQGHAGKLVFGRLETKQVMVLQGRVHYYEGYSMDQVTLPVRVMQRLGVKTLIVTNAAGAINPKYAPGDLMLITDHISLIAMAGLNPLRGPNLDEFGPRFPDMSQPYNRELGVLAREISNEFKLGMKEGVYLCLAGPSFESPADLRFLRAIGADAVGMSTVPEVIIARHGGTRVVGISGISNKANLDGNTVTTHEEVLEAGNLIVPKLEILIRELLKRS